VNVNATVRNVAIVLVLAAIVDIVPGGGTAAGVLGQAIALAFLAALAWFVRLMYRQYRFSLYALGDRRRAVLYVAAGVLTLTLTATHRLWASSGGEVAWLVLIGASVYAAASILIAARRS
jgi:hypothetical protein